MHMHTLLEGADVQCIHGRTEAASISFFSFMTLHHYITLPSFRYLHYYLHFYLHYFITFTTWLRLSHHGASSTLTLSVTNLQELRYDGVHLQLSLWRMQIDFEWFRGICPEIPFIQHTLLGIEADSLLSCCAESLSRLIAGYVCRRHAILRKEETPQIHLLGQSTRSTSFLRGTLSSSTSTTRRAQFCSGGPSGTLICLSTGIPARTPLNGT